VREGASPGARAGDRVVITEDTVTRGASQLEAARVVQDLGAEVVLILAIVDRGGTAGAVAAKEGLRFAALFSAPDLGFPTRARSPGEDVEDT